MKYSRSAVQSKVHALPELRFEDQELTSFSGLILFQKLFAVLDLKARLHACFRAACESKSYPRCTVFLQLIVHLILGYRRLRDCQHYRCDPLVRRVLGLGCLPDASTLSRMLKDASVEQVEHVRRLLREMVLCRLQLCGLKRVTLDLDGSVQTTRRFAQGSAVPTGRDRKRKGDRSYYPLFCTVAQTGQVLDVLHRPGNVHDSNGAIPFLLACIDAVRTVLPNAIIEVRMDGAFFSDEMLSALEEAGVQYTVSVPFARFVELKELVQERIWWWPLRLRLWYFESRWGAKSWNCVRRLLFVRTRSTRRSKQPLQLNLFEPYQRGYDFKVIVTNKDLAARSLIAYHNGRGSQEGLLGELQSDCAADYVPVRTRCGNQLFLLAGLFAHNLGRELQMSTQQPLRSTTHKRATLWTFEKLATLRKTLIQRAGRLTRPRGTLTLTISANPWLKKQINHSLEALAALT